MALNFTGANTEKVNFGNALAANNLNPLTYVAWIYPTATSGNFFICSKAGASFSAEKWLIVIDGELAWEYQRATEYAAVWSASTPIVTNQWQQVVLTWNGSSNPSLYHGNLTTRTPIAEVGSYGTRSGGSGAVADDSGNPVTVGNIASAADESWSFQGRIACVMWFNRVLTLGEMRDLQYRPRRLPGTAFYTHLGFPGTTCPEWSGGGYSAASFIGSPTNAPHAPFAPLLDYRGGWQGNYAPSPAGVGSPGDFFGALPVM